MAKQQKPGNARPQPSTRPTQQRPKTPTSTPERATSSGVGPAWFGWLAAALGLLLFANTIGHQYCLDDYGAIKENWIVKGQYFGKIFTTEYRFGSWASPGNLYRPLVLSMFSIEYALVGENPWLHHLVNILTYGLTGWVLWITWRRILADYPWTLAAAAVLIFLAHPVHCEVVPNIKSRDEILSLLGGTAALYFVWNYLETERAKWLYYALAVFGAGLFCKESGVLFVAIIPLTLWFFNRAPLSKIVSTSLYFLIPTAIFLLARWNALHDQKFAEVYSILDQVIVGAKNPSERFGTAFMLVLRYFQVLVAPYPLISDLGYPQTKVVSMTDWRAVLGAVLYLGSGIWALLNVPKKHFLAYAILFFHIMFVLSSNVFLVIGTSYGERLLYAPSWGFALALAWGLHKVLGLLNPPAEGEKRDTTVFWSVVGVIVAVFSLITINRNPAWKDSFALYEADYPNSPNCAKLNYHRALEITDKGLDKKTGNLKDAAAVQKGVEAYTRAIELFPEYHDAYGSRGLAYFRLQQYDKAFDDYQKALKHRPNDAKVLSNLGYIYFMRAQRPGNQLALPSLDSAEAVYRRSIEFDPRFVDARRNLGAVLAMKKQFPAAIEQWKEGLKYEPKSAILNFYIGSAYRDMGDPTSAGPWLDKAYQLDPSLKK